MIREFQLCLGRDPGKPRPTYPVSARKRMAKINKSQYFLSLILERKSTRSKGCLSDEQYPCWSMTISGQLYR